MRVFLKYAVYFSLLFVAVIWNYGAIQFLPNIPAGIRSWLVTGLFISAALVLSRRVKWLGIAGVAATSVAMIVCFFLLQPSNDRTWEPSVARLPLVERLSENLVTIKNVRNFRYTSETDFIENYYDKTFDINELSSVDFIASYWAGRPIAHIMVSFGFAEKDFLAFTIEARKEVGENYSTFAGFYRNYELIYIAADERDVIGVRAKIRQPAERVHLLRTNIIPDRARKLFRQYLHEVERLGREPKFYNALTTNCTTQILHNAQTYNPDLTYNWKVLLSGYLPDLLYEMDAVDTSVTFESLFAASEVNDRANLGIEGEDFSRRIREGLKTPKPRL